MSNSPVPGFQPLSTEFTEKWHAQADIDDPPFKRPMLAQMAHMEARQRGEAFGEKVRDVKASAQEAIYQVALFAALIFGLVLASFVPLIVTGVLVGASTIMFTVSAFAASKKKKELFALTAQKLAAEKEAGEHWNKFVKLTTEADSKIKVLQDAPVEQK